MSAVAMQINSVFQRDIPSNSSAEIIRHVFPRSRVRVPWPQSSWFKRLRTRFDELTSLRHGWDGYRGVPVSFNCALFASGMLESIFDEDVDAPFLVPKSDGSLQVEWHLNGYDIEIEVLKPFEVLALRHDNHSDLTEEVELQDDFGLLAEWVADLSRERNPVERAGI